MKTDTWTTEGLEAGDVVMCCGGWRGEPVGRRTVERTTKTQIILSNGQRYRRNGGVVCGDRWSRSTIAEPTEKLIAELRRRVAIGKAHGIDMKKLTDEQIALMAKIYDDQQRVPA